MDGIIILTGTLKKWGVRVWTEFKCGRMGSSGNFL
jgi:hypothetical protein